MYLIFFFLLLMSLSSYYDFQISLLKNDGDKSNRTINKHVFEPNYEQLLVAELNQTEYFNDPQNLPSTTEQQQQDASSKPTEGTSIAKNESTLEEIS